MTVLEFYDACADLLGVPHDAIPFPYRYRTRWNNRTPGRGRFEGRGLIRAFGDTVHITLYAPALTTVISGFEPALDFLRNAVRQED